MCSSPASGLCASEPACFKYNKFYIGLARHGQTTNFLVLRPKTEWHRLDVRVEPTDELQTKIDASGIDLMGEGGDWGRYRIRLGKSDVQKHTELIRTLIRQAYDETMS